MKISRDSWYILKHVHLCEDISAELQDDSDSQAFKISHFCIFHRWVFNCKYLFLHIYPYICSFFNRKFDNRNSDDSVTLRRANPKSEIKNLFQKLTSHLFNSMWMCKPSLKKPNIVICKTTCSTSLNMWESNLLIFICFLAASTIFHTTTACLLGCWTRQNEFWLYEECWLVSWQILVELSAGLQ